MNRKPLRRACLRDRQRPRGITIHGLLKNERQWRVIHLLRDTTESMALRELSERIAESEADTSGASDEMVQSVYVSLVQTHLPKLADCNLIRYDEEGNTVRLSGKAEGLSYPSSLGGNNDDRFAKSYAALSLAGLAGIGLCELGFLGGTGIDSQTLAVGTLGLLIGCAAYQIRSEKPPSFRS